MDRQCFSSVIYVGTCGYSYDDWVGSFYPPKAKRGEMLRYYAARFSAVEIDASYYGVPSAATIASIGRRTPRGFRMSFKAPQTVTHARDLRAPVHDDAARLRDVLAPLAEGGKLACVLLQFPHGYKRTTENELYLARAIAAFDPLPVVVEFRSRAWQDSSTLALLHEVNASLCNVDTPVLDDLPHASSDAVGPIGYVRFHGRNAVTWWSGTNVTRYRYLYSEDELEPWTERVVEIDAHVRESYAFFNNHARGNAPRNAEMFEALLRERFGMSWEEHIVRPSVPPMPATPSLFEEP